MRQFNITGGGHTVGWRFREPPLPSSAMTGALECIILVGLPGAGKTSFYEERLGGSHTHISKDLWPNASRREARQQKLIDETLAVGKSIVVDNTNPTAAERVRIITAAKARAARVTGYFFGITTRAAVARNASRTGKSRVPNVAIFTTAKRLQPPTLGEGFDELFRIELTEDRKFRITKIRNNRLDCFKQSSSLT